MAVVQNDFAVSRFGSGGDFSPVRGGGILSDDEGLQIRSVSLESDVGDDEDEEEEVDEEEEDDEDNEDDGEDDDVDSGAGSDDYDLSDLGEIGAEFCQVGNRNCSLPFELYDLPDLTGILSVDTWNNCLTEDERFSLTEYLPDMDQETFMRTLKELFAGSNFHFGSPLTELFHQLKGGLCDPRVALYRRGLNYFEKCLHYHVLRKYQNSMVSSIIQIRDAWQNCAAYSIEERLRLLNILRSKRSLMYEEDDELGSDMADGSAMEESFDGFATKRAEDDKLDTKSTGRAVYTVRSSLDASFQGKAMALELAEYRKQDSKGNLNFDAPKASSKKAKAALTGHGLGTKYRSSVTLPSLHRKDRVVGHSVETARHMRGDMKANDGSDGRRAHEMGIRKNQISGNGVTVPKVNSLKPGKRQEFLKRCDSRTGWDEEDTASIDGVPYPVDDENFQFYGRDRSAKMLANRKGKAGNGRSYEYGKRSKYDADFQFGQGKDGENSHFHVRSKNAKKLMTCQLINDKNYESGRKTKYPEKLDRSLKGGQVEKSAGNQAFGKSKTQEQTSKLDDGKSKKWRIGEEFKTGKRSSGLDVEVRSYKTSPVMNKSYFQSDHRAKTPAEKIRRKFAQNGGLKKENPRDSQMFTQSQETESDSSEQIDKDINYMTRRSGSYQSGILEGGVSASVRSRDDHKKVSSLGRKVKNEYADVFEGVVHTSVNVSGLGEKLHVPEIEIYSSKGKKRGQTSEPNYLHDRAPEHLEKTFSASAKLSGDHKQISKSMKPGQMQDDLGEMSKVLLKKTYSERKLKGKIDVEDYVSGSNSIKEYANASGILDGGDLHVTPKSVDNQERKQKRKTDVTYVDGSDEPDYLQTGLQQPIDEPNFSKKRAKKTIDLETSYSPPVTSDAPISERGMADMEPETKPLKKPFTLIMPSIHTGFSFSIVHFLTAVRMAMITVHADDTSEVDKHFQMNDGKESHKQEEHVKKLEGADAALPSEEKLDINCSEHPEQNNLPALSVQEIVDRVRSNPKDPCILETQEPLQDLVRGVLKIFSSKTAPLGAKGWKPLVFYEKSIKSWSWIGPLSGSVVDHETAEEDTSPEAWGVPHKMLVKLVDSFANWLKSGQETLKLIGSLPPPPMMPMPNMDEKDRFKDLRAQKSLVTISPSSGEVREYFRKEEFLRYSIPDRAFSYTATDGKKSIVAPLRRCGGKPTSKARDHFMLKPDRPPHVTILCLVRDAAARLPRSIGTRADVCTLIRDSQYIVEDVSDSQVNQVVSGALDRLHYERDPCVQFDAERKLWVYLHRDREEEDFEDDGTSSTKKWKRPRKDATEQSDTGAVNDVGYQGPGDQVTGGPVPLTGCGLSSQLDAEPSSTVVGEKSQLVYNDSKPSMEESIEPFIDPVQECMHTNHPMGWEVLELNPLPESQMLCQENSTNEDFRDEAFSRSRPGGLLSTSFM